MSNELPHDLSPQLNYAMYLPAISPGYGEMAVKAAKQERAMPAGLTPQDLNFLDPNNKLFYLPAALYSAGIVPDLSNPPKTMITARAKKTSHVVADSGGFQIASGKIAIGNTWQRKEIFDWQSKYSDYGMTLDVPALAIDNSESGYTNFSDCLNDTLEHLADYDLFYEKSKFPLLNVLQGRDRQESDQWYNAVKAYQFDGWAIAGPHRQDLYYVVRRILTLIDEGRLNQKESWVHFLGLGKFKVVTLLTIIRDCVRRKLKDDGIHFSMDTSSPGLTAMRHRRVYTGVNFTAKNFTLSSQPIPFNNPKYLGSTQPFPYPCSPIGKLLTMGDLIVKQGTHMNSRLDMLSACMLANHNYYVYSRGIMAANEELAKHPGLIINTVPVSIQDAKRAIEDVFDAADPWAELQKQKKTLDKV